MSGGVAVGEGVAVGVADGISVADGIGVGLGVKVGVGVSVGTDVASGVAVAVAVAVAGAGAVAVLMGVGDGVAATCPGGLATGVGGPAIDRPGPVSRKLPAESTTIAAPRAPHAPTRVRPAFLSGAEYPL
jgi:hypothetical protein